jgi:hypothetical protein
MPVVWRGDANSVHWLTEELRDRVRSDAAHKGGNAIAGPPSVFLSAPSSAAGDCRQLNVNWTDVTAVQAFGVQLLEQRPIGFVEDHSQADHTDPDTRSKCGGSHHADHHNADADGRKHGDPVSYRIRVVCNRPSNNIQ